MRRVPVVGGRVQLLLVFAGRVWLDVEDHFLDRAGEREWLLTRIAQVDDPAVVAADVDVMVASRAGNAGR